MNLSKVFKLLPLLIIMVACKEEPVDAPGVVLPTNLTLSIDDSNASSGLIILAYSADGANFYTIDFGDGSETLRTNDTDLTHEYNADGTYEITVNAHTTTTDFITETGSVVIEIDANTGDDGYTTPLSYDGYTLVWNDEFDGNSLNTDDWNYEIGNGCPSLCGWGNNELQYYTQENTTVADGYLIITAKEESQDGFDYTSSRLTTQGKQSFKYGRIDIRAKLPRSKGMWPALWMLGDNIETVGWPSCGEIDIMELVGGPSTDDEVHGTLHWDNNGSYACTCQQGKYTLDNGIFNDKFHVFTIIWDENSIEWYVDDEPMRRSGGAPFETSINSAAMSEFQNEFFFIFNIAVGGNWPGSPDGTTAFPQRMLVDYVRVFQ